MIGKYLLLGSVMIWGPIKNPSNADHEVITGYRRDPTRMGSVPSVSLPGIYEVWSYESRTLDP